MYYRRRKRQRRLQSYLFPLIILVLVFVGGYFLVKGVGYLFSMGNDDAKVALYLEQGSVTVEPFGEDAPLTQIIPGQPVFAGDIIRTGSSSRAVLVFFDATQIRLAPNSELEIDQVESSDSKEVVHLNLNRGEVWSSVLGTDPTKEYDYVVSTANMNVKATGNKFDVKAQLPEYVRVLSGSVSVEVKTIEGGEQRVLESVPVSIAQELTLTPAALDAFVARSAAEVLGAISEQFERSAWYDWNVALDLNPALVLSFTGNSPLANVGGPDEAPTVTENPDDTLTVEDETATEDEEPATDTSALPAPLVSSPVVGASLSTGSVVIEGTTSATTERLEVTSFEDGRAVPYVLQRYEAGSKSWRYIATYDGGNLAEGENKFEVRAIDADGNKSEPTVVTFTYTVPVAEGVDIVTTPPAPPTAEAEAEL